MTDRELLELAAKAAGIVLFEGGPDVRVPDECQARVYARGGLLTILFYSDAGDNPLCKRIRPSGNVEWNPLTDDGDALRLAVQLRMTVANRNNMHGEFAYAEAPGYMFCPESLSGGADPRAATRRAIVRAAAEIGKAMP